MHGAEAAVVSRRPRAATLSTDEQGAPLTRRDRPDYSPDYSPEQAEKLRRIHERVAEARRELDALIGDAYLRSRASIVPVHFLDLASAVEKLRWAEKEWRELDKQVEEEEESHLLAVGETAQDQEEARRNELIELARAESPGSS